MKQDVKRRKLTKLKEASLSSLLKPAPSKSLPHLLKNPLVSIFSRKPSPFHCASLSKCVIFTHHHGWAANVRHMSMHGASRDVTENASPPDSLMKASKTIIKTKTFWFVKKMGSTRYQILYPLQFPNLPSIQILSFDPFTFLQMLKKYYYLHCNLSFLVCHYLLCFNPFFCSIANQM